MNSEEAKKIASGAIAALADALKAGRSEQLVAYLKAAATFHRYSINNILLIVTQRPDATHVAGFQTWKQLGRWVRKGEKGIVILAPMTFRKADQDAESTGDGRPPKPILRFRAVHVFDISQTDGQLLPEAARYSGDPSTHLVRLKELVNAAGIALSYGDVPPGASGVSRGGAIALRSDLAPAEEFAVLVHEFAHEVLHRGDDRPPSRTVRETEAEAVAFVVASAIGLNPATSASDYITLYDGDEKTLAASLERIQRTAATMIVGLLGGEDHAFEVEHGEPAPALSPPQRELSR